MTNPQPTPSEHEDCPPVGSAQHTPGPWKAFNKNGKHVQADEWSTSCDGSGSSTHAPIKAGTQVVALVVASSRRWPDLPDIAPNCRLIAAAPDMHELLATFTDWARQVAGRPDVPPGIRSAAANLHDDGKRLIARTTGENQ
jgi:hypothetical protein